MSIVQATIEIDAPPSRVWDVVADPTNLPLWDRHIVDVEGVPSGGIRAGTSYRVRMRFMGVGTTIPAMVVEVRKDEYAKVHLDGLMEATVETWLEALEAQRTRLRHRAEYRFRGGRLGSLVARAVNVIGAPTLLRRGMAAQKRQVEGG